MSYLVVDIGTSHCRAAVVAETGEVLSQSRAPIELRMGPGSAVEVDTDHVWGQVKRVVSEELHKHPRGSFHAVGVSSMLGYVLLDGDDRPLMPAIIWMDNRAGEEAREILDRFTEEELYRKTRRRLSPELLAPKLLWLSKHRPDLFARTRRVIGLKDEIVRRLTGSVVTDVAHLNYTLLFNIERGELDPELLDGLGIAPDLFPAARLATEIAGGVSDDAAQETGLDPSIPVIVGSSDGTTAMYGAGALEEGRAALVSGTTDVLMMSVSSPLRDPTRTLSVNTGMAPGMFLAGGAMGLSGGALQHVAGLLKEPVEQYEVRIAGLGPGAGGLLFFPGLSGERAPYWKSSFTGGVLGLTLDHKAEHLFRAVMEGTALRLLKLLRVMESNGARPTSLNVVGGCSRMDVWNQIRADVTGLEVVRLKEAEATVLGTAIFCKTAVGAGGTLAETARERIVAEKKYLPNREATLRYGELFELFDAGVQAAERVFDGLEGFR